MIVTIFFNSVFELERRSNMWKNAVSVKQNFSEMEIQDLCGSLDKVIWWAYDLIGVRTQVLGIRTQIHFWNLRTCLDETLVTNCEDKQSHPRV